MNNSDIVESHANILSKKERNYGIDLLRIVSMFYVILLHALGQGGVLKTVAPNSMQYMASWFLEVFSYGAVNIFALISGFVSYSDYPKKLKPTHYAMLWCQIVFYGVSVTIISQLISPSVVTKKDFLAALFPVTNNFYWYFTAYTGLFFVMPILNAAVRALSRTTLKKIFIVLFLLFSAFDTVVRHFQLNNGYSFLWIAILYLMGAIVKKCGIGRRARPLFLILGIFLLCLISWAWKVYGVDFYLFKIKVAKGFLVSYTSPTVLCSSVLHLLLFMKLSVAEPMRKIISFAAPAAFAAYILNNNPVVWSHVMKNLFIPIAGKQTLIIVLCVLLFSVAFLTLSILIDKIRIFIFNLVRLQKWLDYIVRAAEKTLDKVAAQI